MTQKVLKVGTSAAATIPKASLKELGLKIGDKVFTTIDYSEKVVIFSKKPIQNISFSSKRDAEVRMQGEGKEFKVTRGPNNIRGCLAKINF